jgi:bifunctional polynucleotide phosphatase/kinase
MDGTLIKTKSGLVFPKDCNDWQLLYPEVPNKLKQFHANGYKVVIFTNQAGLGTGKVKIKDFKLKIEKVVQKINVPIQVMRSSHLGAQNNVQKHDIILASSHPALSRSSSPWGETFTGNQ